MKGSPLAFIVLIGLGIWIILNPLENYFQRIDSEPRAVTARGDLAQDELNTPRSSGTAWGRGSTAAMCASRSVP